MGIFKDFSRNSAHDFSVGFHAGFSVISSGNRYLHQGVSSLKKAEEILKHLSNVPILNDAITLIIDNPEFAEVLSQINLADQVSGDVTKTLKDLDDIFKTGRFRAIDSTPKKISTNNPYHQGIGMPKAGDPDVPVPISTGIDGAKPFDDGFKSPVNKKPRNPDDSTPPINPVTPTPATPTTGPIPGIPQNPYIPAPSPRPDSSVSKQRANPFQLGKKPNGVSTPNLSFSPSLNTHHNKSPFHVLL